MTILKLTAIGYFINIVQVNLFGAKVVVSCSNGVVKLAIASILRKDHSKVTVLFMALEKLLQFLFIVKCMNSYLMIFQWAILIIWHGIWFDFDQKDYFWGQDRKLIGFECRMKSWCWCFIVCAWCFDSM